MSAERTHEACFTPPCLSVSPSSSLPSPLLLKLLPRSSPLLLLRHFLPLSQRAQPSSSITQQRNQHTSVYACLHPPPSLSFPFLSCPPPPLPLQASPPPCSPLSSTHNQHHTRIHSDERGCHARPRPRASFGDNLRLQLALLTPPSKELCFDPQSRNQNGETEGQERSMGEQAAARRTARGAGGRTSRSS